MSLPPPATKNPPCCLYLFIPISSASTPSRASCLLLSFPPSLPASPARCLAVFMGYKFVAADDLSPQPLGIPLPAPAVVSFCSCALSCGACGGSGCASRSGGNEACCGGAIQSSGLLCSETGEAPCIIDDGEINLRYGVLVRGLSCFWNVYWRSWREEELLYTRSSCRQLYCPGHLFMRTYTKKKWSPIRNEPHPLSGDRHMVNSSVADQLLISPLVYLVLIRAPQQPPSTLYRTLPSLFFMLFLPPFSCSSQTWQLPRRSTATPRTAPRRLPLWLLLRLLLPLRHPLRRALRPLR